MKKVSALQLLTCLFVFLNLMVSLTLLPSLTFCQDESAEEILAEADRESWNQLLDNYEALKSTVDETSEKLSDILEKWKSVKERHGSDPRLAKLIDELEKAGLSKKLEEAIAFLGKIGDVCKGIDQVQTAKEKWERLKKATEIVRPTNDPFKRLERISGLLERSAQAAEILGETVPGIGQITAIIGAYAKAVVDYKNALERLQKKIEENARQFCKTPEAFKFATEARLRNLYSLIRNKDYTLICQDKELEKLGFEAYYPVGGRGQATRFIRAGSRWIEASYPCIGYVRRMWRIAHSYTIPLETFAKYCRVDRYERLEELKERLRQMENAGLCRDECMNRLVKMTGLSKKYQRICQLSDEKREARYLFDSNFRKRLDQIWDTYQNSVLLTGKVMDLDGKAVEGATVEAAGKAVKTDGYGDFDLILPGSLLGKFASLSISKKFFDTARYDVHVEKRCSFPPYPLKIERKMERIVIEPEKASISTGTKQSFKAYVIYKDGKKKEITSSKDAVWSPSRTFHAKAEGTYQVSVRFRNHQATATIEVFSPAKKEARTGTKKKPKPKALRVVPARKTVNLGESVSFRAIVTFDDGTEKDVTGSRLTRWSPARTMKTDRPGSIKVSANYKGLKDSVTIRVIDPCGPVMERAEEALEKAAHLLDLADEQKDICAEVSSISSRLEKIEKNISVQASSGIKFINEAKQALGTIEEMGSVNALLNASMKRAGKFLSFTSGLSARIDDCAWLKNSSALFSKAIGLGNNLATELGRRASLARRYQEARNRFLRGRKRAKALYEKLFSKFHLSGKLVAQLEKYKERLSAIRKELRAGIEKNHGRIQGIRSALSRCKAPEAERLGSRLSAISVRLEKALDSCVVKQRVLDTKNRLSQSPAFVAFVKGYSEIQRVSVPRLSIEPSKFIEARTKVNSRVGRIRELRKKGATCVVAARKKGTRRPREKAASAEEESPFDSSYLSFQNLSTAREQERQQETAEKMQQDSYAEGARQAEGMNLDRLRDKLSEGLIAMAHTDTGYDHGHDGHHGPDFGDGHEPGPEKEPESTGKEIPASTEAQKTGARSSAATVPKGEASVSKRPSHKKSNGGRPKKNKGQGIKVKPASGKLRKGKKFFIVSNEYRQIFNLEQGKRIECHIRAKGFVQIDPSEAHLCKQALNIMCSTARGDQSVQVCRFQLDGPFEKIPTGTRFFFKVNPSCPTKSGAFRNMKHAVTDRGVVWDCKKMLKKAKEFSQF